MGSSKWSWICPALLSLNPTFAEPSVARCREVVTCSLCSACCGHAVHYQLDTTPGGVLKSQSLEMTKCATSAGADAAQRQPRGANRSGSRAAQAAAAAAQCSARASAVAGGRLNTATVHLCEGCTIILPMLLCKILDPCLPSQVYNAQRQACARMCPVPCARQCAASCREVLLNCHPRSKLLHKILDPCLPSQVCNALTWVLCPVPGNERQIAAKCC
jgi:hypothetical protein